MTRRVVITSQINPPIPTRDYDWQATLDNYDPGEPIGHGPSEAFAVYDLFMEIEVHEEAQELKRKD